MAELLAARIEKLRYHDAGFIGNCGCDLETACTWRPEALAIIDELVAENERLRLEVAGWETDARSGGQCD